MNRLLLPTLRSPEVTVGVIVLLSACALALWQLSTEGPYRFLWADPGWMAQVSRSLVEDGDLDLRNQLNFSPAEASDQTARGLRGEWYPVHEPLLAILGAPFFALASWWGLLIANILLHLTFAHLVFRVTAQVAPGNVAAVATVLTFLTPYHLNYASSFSIDLLGATLLTGAVLAAISGRSVSAGFWIGATVVARHHYVVWLPWVAVLLLCGRHPKSLILGRFIGGGLPWAAALMALSWWQFGSPLSLPYHHWQYEAGGVMIQQSQATLFQLPSATGVIDRLFFSITSPLLNNPLGWLALLAIALTPAWRARTPLLLIVFGALLTHGLWIFCYGRGFPGLHGDRYLMGGTALLAVPLALVLLRLCRPQQQ